MSAFYDFLENDKSFRDKLNAVGGEEGRALLREAGFEVKDVKDFLDRVQKDTDFMEAISDKETKEEKKVYIMQEGYYFTADELAAEQERIAEEEFDTLAGAGCGLYIEGHCGSNCESEDWAPPPHCDKYFKCTWG